MRPPAPAGRPEPGAGVLQAVDGNHTPRPRLRCMVSPPLGGRAGTGVGPKPGSGGSAGAAATPSPRRMSTRGAAHALGGASPPEGGRDGGRAAALRAAQRALAARLAAGEGRVRCSYNSIGAICFIFVLVKLIWADWRRTICVWWL